MSVLAVLFGLGVGVALAGLVYLQVRSEAVPGRRLLAATALLAAACCVWLWVRLGWMPRFWLLSGAALVLIDTAAVDWQLKLIDTLLLAIATAAAVLGAPWIMEQPDARASSLIAMAGAGGAFGVAWLAARWLYGGEAEPFGLGDVVLGAFIGALFGTLDVVAALLIGIVLAGLAALAVIVARGYQRARGIALPYGTFLCLGALLYLMVV